MKTISLTKPDLFITGNLPVRELSEAEALERNEPIFHVAYQCGFEQFVVAVVGDMLCEADAEESAEEHLLARGWFANGIPMEPVSCTIQPNA